MHLWGHNERLFFVTAWQHLGYGYSTVHLLAWSFTMMLLPPHFHMSLSTNNIMNE